MILTAADQRTEARREVARAADEGCWHMAAIAWTEALLTAALDDERQNALAVHLSGHARPCRLDRDRPDTREELAHFVRAAFVDVEAAVRGVLGEVRAA